METAELTKNEQAHVERLSEPLSQPSMKERFEEWAQRAISDSKKDQKEREGSHRPREISLKDRPEAEREWIEAVAEKDGSAKESRRDRSAEKEPTAHGEQRPKATESGKPDSEKPASESTKTPVEPMAAADRYWQSKSDGKPIDAKEVQRHWQSVDSRAGVALEFINSHAEKDTIVQGLKAFFAGKPKAWQDAFSPDFYTALAEVASPGEVLRHIALQPLDRDYLRNCKDWKELRAAIQTIAKHYPPAASQSSPKPRAPKPPSEVGGRGAAGDDGTRGAEDFGDFSSRQSRRYGRHA